MDHNDIRHMLSEYIDGALAAEEQTLIEEHLEACQECGHALNELRKTVEHIRNVEEMDPPPWMTQKIMARVREEEEKRKQGLFHRIFFPLQVKLPLETIGVLFIAVTVYFVARDVQQTKHLVPEASVQTNSRKPAADRGAASGPEDSLQKKLSREPEHRAHDMKPAYEKPESFAPAPEPLRHAEKKRALQSEPSRRKRAAEQPAPGFMQYPAPVKEFSDQGAAPRAPAAGIARNKAAASIGAEEEGAETAAAEMSGRKMLTLLVSDVDRAAAGVENAVREYGGKIILKEPAPGALSLTVAVDPADRNRFIGRLKILGELQGMDPADVHGEKTVIKIGIIKQVERN